MENLYNIVRMPFKKNKIREKENGESIRMVYHTSWSFEIIKMKCEAAHFKIFSTFACSSVCVCVWV